MRVSNQLETVVLNLIDDACCRRPPAPHFCSCPLCRADVAALALTNLPPQYTTGWVELHPDAGRAEGAARSAVAAAMRRIAACPRHEMERPEQEDAVVRIVNHVFEEVADLVLHCSLEERNVCFCGSCTADMMAYSLNRYPSKYGVVWRGVSNLLRYQREELRDDLKPMLRKAAEVVAAQPSH